MITYLYTTQDASGQISKGTIKAESLQSARVLLTHQKVFPLSLRELPGGWLQRVFQPKPTVPEDDIVVFSQIFASTIRSGISIKESLQLLSVQFEQPVLKQRMSEVLVDLEGGLSLSAAFAKHVDVFPSFYPMLIKTGEVSGDIAGVLDYIGTYLEQVQEIRKDVISVFTYPAIVSGLSVVLLGLILWRVAPRFKEVFASAKLVLPAPTQLMFGLSDVLVAHGQTLGVGVVCALGLFLVAKRRHEVRLWLDKMVVMLPLIGPVIRGALMIRFLRAFEILVVNNVPILQALGVLEEATSNLVLKQAVSEMRLSAARGLPMSGPLTQYPTLVSPIVAHTIVMGEKSGNLGESLQRIGQFANKELRFAMKKLSSRLDPILTFGLGLMVLWIALSIYLPIFDMISVVGV